MKSLDANHRIAEEQQRRTWFALLSRKCKLAANSGHGCAFPRKPPVALANLTAQCLFFSFSNWINRFKRHRGSKVGNTAQTKRLMLTFVLTTLSACGNFQLPGMVSRQDASLTPVQACAIGYDLASQIYARVVLEETIIIPGARPGACEAHTLTYLKQAGFKIDETAPGPAMTVDLSPGEDGSVAAIATITMNGGTLGGGTLGSAGSLRLGRSYRLAETGVYPQGAVSFITLPEGASPRRSRGISAHRQRGDQ